MNNNTAAIRTRMGDDARPGVYPNSVLARPGMDPNAPVTRTVQGQLEQSFQLPHQQPYKQQQQLSYPQRAYQQSHKSPNQQGYVDPSATNTSPYLIYTPRPSGGPKPPRWRWEDKAIIPPLIKEPVTTGDTDDKEEGSLGDLCNSPSSEDLARSSVTFQSLLDPAYTPCCPYVYKGRCAAARELDTCCPDKIHFRRIIHARTNVRLGDCSFLDSCDLADKCPYVHYASEFPRIPRSNLDKVVEKARDLTIEAEVDKASLREVDLKSRIKFPPSEGSPPEWIRCDISQIDLGTIGKFGVIMADPPWDIRMTLPYGTVPDRAILELPLGKLQDHGIIFLWCTARTVDTGHACLRAWGYEFCDEIAWVKVDHLSRLITVGRTGHWLNHTMEHCLVGSKGTTDWVKKLNDLDVIVAQPRDTSHKPDQIYEMIERLVGPDVRKVELFGREHNIRKGWLTLGNQLPSTFIYTKALKESYMQYLAHIGRSHTYSPDWNPWAQGFDRYGYGEQNDWREERRRNAMRNVSGDSGKGRGGGGGRGQHDQDGSQNESSRNRDQQLPQLGQQQKNDQQSYDEASIHASNEIYYNLPVSMAESNFGVAEVQSSKEDATSLQNTMYTDDTLKKAGREVDTVVHTAGPT